MKQEVPTQRTTKEAFDFPPASLRPGLWSKQSHEADDRPVRASDTENLTASEAAGSLALHIVIDLI